MQAMVSIPSFSPNEAGELGQHQSKAGPFGKTSLFGVTSAPAIFQWAIESLLQGAPLTAVFLDDVIITGKTQVEYENNLL